MTSSYFHLYFESFFKAITPMRLDEEDVQRDRMASLPNSSRLVDQPSGDGEVQENWLENLPGMSLIN